MHEVLDSVTDRKISHPGAPELENNSGEAKALYLRAH